MSYPSFNSAGFYQDYQDAKLAAVRRKIWDHCKTKMSTLITEKELMSGPGLTSGSESCSLLGVSFEDQQHVKQALNILQLNGDLVPLIFYTDARVHAREDISPGTRQEKKEARKKARQVARKAARKAAIQGVTALSELRDYVVDSMKGIVGHPDINNNERVFVAEFTLQEIAWEVYEALEKEANEYLVKGLIPIETLRHVYNKSVGDSFTLARLHLYFTSRQRIRAIPYPDRPYIIHVKFTWRWPSISTSIIANDLKEFWNMTDIVYTGIELATRGMADKDMYYLFPNVNLSEALILYDDPAHRERLARLSDDELTARLTELESDDANQMIRSYSVDRGLVDVDAISGLFGYGVSLIDRKVTDTMFCFDSPYQQDLVNLYKLVTCAFNSWYPSVNPKTAPTSLALVNDGQPTFRNDLCDLKYTFKALNILLNHTGRSLYSLDRTSLRNLNASHEYLASSILYDDSVNDVILYLAIAIHKLALQLSSSYPTLENLDLSSFALYGRDLADLLALKEMESSEDETKYRYPATADRALIIYILANLALAHPDLVYKPMVNLGLATPGLSKFLLANPELAHSRMAQFVLSYPALINACLAMHIVANLVLTSPQSPKSPHPDTTEPVSPESAVSGFPDPEVDTTELDLGNPELADSGLATSGLDNPDPVYAANPAALPIDNPEGGNIQMGGEFNDPENNEDLDFQLQEQLNGPPDHEDMEI